MVPRKNRLTRADFTSLPRSRRLHGELFLLSVAPSQAEHSKFSCIVSKKVSLRAVDRNLIKRRARAILTKIILNKFPRQNFVLTAKPKSLQATYKDMEVEIQKLVQEASRP